MKKALVTVALCLGAVAAQAAPDEGPAIINVMVVQKCALFIEPGHRDFKAVFPSAQVVYKKSAEGASQQVQSCEVDVPKDAFLKQFPFCALSGLIGGHGQIVYNYAGGRMVELNLESNPGAPEALAAFACMPR